MISSVRLAKWYLQLRPVPVVDYFVNPVPNVRPHWEYDSEAQGKDDFLAHFPGLKPSGKLLDLGCGFGGRTVRYKELGAEDVTGLECQRHMLKEAREFATQKSQEVTFVEGAAERLPFGANSFDQIFSYDVFEHVYNFKQSMYECFRVLKPGGTLYCVFPPFHHPTGGAHFHSYLSSSPAPNTFFSCKALRKAMEQIMSERGDTWRCPDRAGDPLPMVNGTTIGKALRAMKAMPFSGRDIKLPPLASRKAWFLNPIFSAGSHVPLLRELSVDRIVAALTK